MTEISPVILASVLANLSSTELASGGDRHRTMARANSTRERHLANPGHADQWRQVDHHCQSASFDNKGAGDELLTKRTLKAERSRSYSLRQWGHHELYPPSDEGADTMMQVR